MTPTPCGGCRRACKCPCGCRQHSHRKVCEDCRSYTVQGDWDVLPGTLEVPYAFRWALR